MPRDYDVLNLFSLVRSKKYKSNVSLCKKIMFWISSMLSNSGDSQFSELQRNATLNCHYESHWFSTTCLTLFSVFRFERAIRNIL